MNYNMRIKAYGTKFTESQNGGKNCLDNQILVLAVHVSRDNIIIYQFYLMWLNEI